MHAEEQVVQLRDRNAELLLDLLRIEAGVMRHLDRASRAIDGNGWVLLRAAQTVVGLVLIVRMLVWEIARGR